MVLVVATLVLRTFRLGEPLNMHFDEVYHARTATEFLQDWRYGDESNIYEWTHPHLGKYLIAAGITAFGDDRVSATGSIDAPVNDALVEPRHTDIATGDQAGARLWLATDTGIRGYDLGSRAEVARYDLGPTGALAHDPTASQLFAATETGELYTLDLAQLDIGGPESVEPFQVADLGVPVDRIAVAEDGTTVLATRRRPAARGQFGDRRGHARHGATGPRRGRRRRLRLGRRRQSRLDRRPGGGRRAAGRAARRGRDRA